MRSVLLRDVIDIPEHAGAEDYVLRLTDSVDDQATAAIASYVVTPALTESFDQALDLVGDALSSSTSRGAFLAGSFGSGKSHFMAVLHAILRHDPHARAKPELQPVIARHDAALQGKRFLPLAFHLLGARSMEEALLGGYVRQVAVLHPDAPLPAVHETDALLADADAWRGRLGDASFFGGLNGDAADTADPWAAVLGSTARWDAGSYTQARGASPDSAQRRELVNALVNAYFPSFTRQAAYVDLETGLDAIAEHAQGLGYAAVVLFLDELVLWLAFAVQDRSFFARESQKLTKLVESGLGRRAIPLVSFVARQLDLSRWFADAGASGAEQRSLEQAFAHQQGRFREIRLGDDNLPYVAQQRLLKPKDAEAARVLTDAFARLDRRPAVWDVLLDGINTDERHRGADEASFRQTYPFSPALVSTLRSLSGVMQRERTALKVMQQMLVDRRDELTVDDVIPVGDVFDHVVRGHSGQALDAAYAARFRAAETLWSDKLRPVLLGNYGLTESEVESGGSVAPAFEADERLARTLLLSAVAVDVPALRSLTAGRLASLNHGSIVTPLPGGEASAVTSKVRNWSTRVPEIRVDNDQRNPVITVQIADVDYESVVEKAKGEDNEGRRRELVKDLVVDSLGLQLGKEDLRGAQALGVYWRGSHREVDLVFGNVRDAGWLSEEHFRARPGTWRFVVDHPFDEPGHSSREDAERVDALVSQGLDTRTIVWLPRFLSDERMKEVRRLVILNRLLDGTGERWTSYADHLGETERVQARAILESQRSSLRQAVLRALQVAYEAAAPTGSNDVIHEGGRVLLSLNRGFAPERPVGASLRAAFDHLVQQAFDATYPAHPRFEPEGEAVATRELVEVARHIDRAMADPDHRIPLVNNPRSVRRVANALGVGSASETHFVFGDDRFVPWNADLERALGRRGNVDGPVTVGELRQWITDLSPAYGLRDEVADLVVIAWAALRQRAWFRYGGSIAAPEPGRLTPEMELRQQALPTPEEWTLATGRAQQAFGVHADAYLTPQKVATLAAQVVEVTQQQLRDASDLVPALEAGYRQAGTALDASAGRLATARQSLELVQQLRVLDGVALIRRLAVTLPAGLTDAVVHRSLTTAREVVMQLGGFRWDRLAPLRAAAGQDDPRGRDAERILDALRQVVESDELVAPLGEAFRTADEDLYEWLTPAPAPEPVDPPEPQPQVASNIRLAPRADLGQVSRELAAFRREYPGQSVDVSWRVVP